MDIWDVCQGEIPACAPRIAALAWQLPDKSRTWREHNPSGAYDTSTLLLREIEYDAHVIRWMFSEDGKNRANEPEPITLPGEELARERAAERADNDALELARAFGMII
jgi:hypothetical protein